MKTYNDEQLRAIQAQGGYYLVLAPPGCGKTDILSERIAKAREQGIDFADMLCLTFTNRASRGMRDRVVSTVGEAASELFVGNIHRFCSNFIFANPILPANTSIVDEDEMADILLSFDSRFLLNSYGTPDKNKLAFIDNLDTYFLQRQLDQPASAYTLSEALLGEYDAYYQTALQAHFLPENVPTTHTAIRYALMYRQYKQAHGMIGFNDLLVYTYEHLRQDSQHAYPRYKWIQVDEVQDLNALQMAIIDELTDRQRDFTVMYLGDEQQAIFSFLGAKMEQLNLLKERCQGHVLTLGVNYRSPKYLLDVFNDFAAKELRVSPHLLPQATDHTPHAKYDLFLTGNETVDDEEERVFKMIDYYCSLSPNDRMAILVPTNAAADRISNKLLAKDIRHFKISGSDIFKSKSYKTLAALFNFMVNEFNTQAWTNLLYGLSATATLAKARETTSRLKHLMLTPADLLRGESYLSIFNKVYEEKEMVFFDTETTGLNVFEDDIVQIAAFKVYKGQKVEGSELNIILHTDREIPEMLGDIPNPLIEAYRTTPHLTREEGLRRFIEYIGQRPLLGHNVMYDYQILQHNVERTLQQTVSYQVFDSLHLIKSVCPDLRMYKLAFLLKELRLEGKNSHLADEDIAATKALTDYCYQQSQSVISQQEKALQEPAMQHAANKLRLLTPLIDDFSKRLYSPVSADNNLAVSLKQAYDYLLEKELINTLGEKFDIFLHYISAEWQSASDSPLSLKEQISTHAGDMTYSINEGDLIGTSADRIFIMTVYKGKGLEFENVVVLQANDGTYPFYRTNQILAAPYRHSKKEIEEAKLARMEDARKFYVALSRAKKRLCVSYSYRNSYGYATKLTPFMECIEQHFIHR